MKTKTFKIREITEKEVEVTYELPLAAKLEEYVYLINSETEWKQNIYLNKSLNSVCGYVFDSDIPRIIEKGERITLEEFNEEMLKMFGHLQSVLNSQTTG